MNRTKLGIITLLFLLGIVIFSHFSNSGLSILGVKTFDFDFSAKQNRNDQELESIVKKNIEGIEGNFAIFIEELPASPSADLKNPKKYALNDVEPYPAASLYKLILMAAVFQEIEAGRLKMEDKISSTKSHLKEVFGGVDFGYEEAPEKISYSLDEALTRIGRISDNFAAIMLTEKLRAIRVSQGSSDRLLVEMARELQMVNTDFESDPINTTAEDIALFFKKLYLGQVVSPQASEKIINYLSLSQLNSRIPALLPKEVKVVHKTGELSRIRHDAGIVFLPDFPNSPYNPYLIILLSKDLKYEDDGVEALAKISKEVWDYFSGPTGN